jgi:hypothetical protein
MPTVAAITSAAKPASRRQRGNDKRHHERDQGRRHKQRRAHRAEHAPGKCGRRDRAADLSRAQPGRNQSCVQRALGEQAPDNIDQLKRHQERIRHRTSAE